MDFNWKYLLNKRIFENNKVLLQLSDSYFGVNVIKFTNKLNTVSFFYIRIYNINNNMFTQMHYK